ncbi:SAM-dependent methyltransferase [Amycolatopsis sp.]|uniref:SAM-dependent methyltransferase n=1 Tax=Amycolatopsis sp. TaxID=37632 RepID=UPI002B644BC3|nr:SAM-dependent methyltransferase [Amycolatopsis sp.]HVV13399.1 SAM-dependent methyltransferase [Amycolatopsis sp.]
MVSPTEIAQLPAVDDPGVLARIRDHWLDGTDNEQVHRDLGERFVVCAPHLPYLVRAERRMLGRMVRYLVSQGVRQFLDLGSGIPSARHVHEVAQEAEPACRVVYVDRDPGLWQDGVRLLAGNDNAAYVCADLLNPGDVWQSPEVQRLLDPARPTAVLVIETLAYLPDLQDPDEVLEGFVGPLAPGSYLGLSHFTPSDQVDDWWALYTKMFGPPPSVTMRPPERLAQFFTGLDLVEPGLVPVPLWRPDVAPDGDRNPERAQVYAGLARKR